MYESLTAERQKYLDRAREVSSLTIPHLVPPEGSKGADLKTPWQSLGARGVNNLAAKLLLAILPPNSPFFKFTANELISEELAAGAAEKTEIERSLVRMERAVMSDIESSNDRLVVFEAFKQLLVAGNVAMFLPISGPARAFRLDQYVVRRDPGGEILQGIIKELVSPKVLPEDIKAEAVAKFEKGTDTTDDEVPVYTVVERVNAQWLKVHQECGDIVIPQSRSMVRVENSPYLFLGWHRACGEDYARSHGEELLGDLIALDELCKAIVQGAGAASRVIWLRNPSAATAAEDFAEAESGDIIDGVDGDIKATQLDKYADFRFALETKRDIEQRLAQAYLITSAVVRNAERVTAEEIRQLATELEDALGGAYSALSLEFQLPYVNRKVFAMQKRGRLPQFPKDAVSPTIVTGLQALGRSHAVNRIAQWAQINKAILGEQKFAESVNADELLKRTGIGLGIDDDGLIKTAQQRAQEAQAAQRAQLMQSAAPEMVRAATQQQQQ